jgi:hypothetical protein
MFKYLSQVKKKLIFFSRKKKKKSLISKIKKLDISVHPNLNSNPKCSTSASSTETNITGDWKDVYVYGYYQNVLEATIKCNDLATSNTSIVYLP